MKRIGKRLPALLLAVCLPLGLLAGCGKKEGTQQLSANVYVPKYLDLGVDVDSISDVCSDGVNLYFIGRQEEELKIPSAGAGSETDAAAYDDAYTYYRTTYDIYRMPLDGSGKAEKLANYVCPAVPEGKEGNAYVDQLAICEDGTLWVTEGMYVWGSLPTPDQVAGMNSGVGAGDIAVDDVVVARSADMPAEVAATEPMEPVEAEDEYYETMFRKRLDKDGGEIASIDLSNLQEALADVLDEGAYVNTTSFDINGNMYVSCDSKIYALDEQLKVRFALEGENLWNELISLGGGLMGLSQWEYDEETETSTNKFRTIDPEKQDWGVEYIMPQNAYNVYPGGGDYLYYYQVNDAIFGFKAGEPDAQGQGTGQGERLFSWLEADISNDNVRDFFFLPDGRVAALLQEWDEDYENSTYSVVLMTSTPRAELPEKTTLVYASLYLGYDVRNRIIDFNKKSDKYRIEVKDYSEFDTDGTGQASLQKLNTEILAGNVPDLLDTSSIPLRQYGAKGILEDLWPFIDNDPDLGRDKLMLRPLEANQQDGRLYEIFSTFSIRTVVGAGKIVGDRNSWTLADLNEALAKMPEGCAIFGQSDTKDGMLNMVVSMNMDQFVDWDKGECSFDSDGFKALLEFCNTFPAEFSWENVDWEEWEEEESRVYTGKQLLVQYSIGSLDRDIARLNAVFNNDVSYVGYPMEDGSCGSSFSTGRGTAMTTACQDKEGAWSFIRQELLPRDEQETGRKLRYYGSFPINKADFDKMTAEAMTPQYETDKDGNNILDDDGNPIPIYGTIWITDGMEVDVEPLSQADVDKIMGLYHQIDSVYRYDDKILDSIKEVAGAYFAGDKPLDDAAKLIQSKVTLYVNENK